MPCPHWCLGEWALFMRKTKSSYVYVCVCVCGGLKFFQSLAKRWVMSYEFELRCCVFPPPSYFLFQWIPSQTIKKGFPFFFVCVCDFCINSRANCCGIFFLGDQSFRSPYCSFFWFFRGGGGLLRDFFFEIFLVCFTPGLGFYFWFVFFLVVCFVGFAPRGGCLAIDPWRHSKRNPSSSFRWVGKRC